MSLLTLTPGFLLSACLPALLGTSGVLVVTAIVVFGGGQVLGTALVAGVIRRRGPRATLVVGAALITSSAGVLVFGHRTPVAALLCLAALGLGTGSVVRPRQVRLLFLRPVHAPVLLGLSGPALYLARATGAALGGIDLAIAHACSPALTACAIGISAVTLDLFVRPDHP